MPQSIKLMAIVAVLLGALIILSGCSVSFTTASLSEATMATRVDQNTKQPLGKTDVFKSNTPVLYATAKLSNAPSDTKVTATWVATDAEGGEKDLEIDTVTVTAEGTRYVSFTLSNDDKRKTWPKGK